MKLVRPYTEEMLEIPICFDDADDLDEIIDCYEGVLSNLRNAKALGFVLGGTGNYSILLIKER